MRMSLMDKQRIEAWNQQLHTDAAARGRSLMEELTSQLKLERGLPLEEIEHQIHMALRLGNLGRLETARALVAMTDRHGCRESSFDSVYEWASDRYDMEPEQIRDYIEVGRALAQLPLMNQAIVDGMLSWEMACLLATVTTPDDEAKWLAWSDGRTFEEVETRVRTRARTSARG